MREGIDAVAGFVAAVAVVGGAGDLFTGSVHAAYGVDDPDFVADADRAVEPAEAVEGAACGDIA